MHNRTRSVDGLARDLFVGRQREMQALKTALEDALAGHGQLVMLVGEPGIGKTRTAQEFAAGAERDGAQIYWGRCYEHPGAPPFWPWVQVIRTYMRGRSAERLYAEMGPGAPDIAAIVPDVRDRWPDLPVSPPLENPEQARFRLFDSIASFLSNAARAQPLVLILDNLHWADKPSLLLLEFLTRALEPSPVLLIGTYRDVEVSRQHPLFETLGELAREPLFRRVPLRGLHREDVGRFMSALAGFAPPPGWVEAVHRQTEGNPLFLMEVIRLMVQEGVLTPGPSTAQGGPGHGTGSGLSLRIPDGVREVIGKRLNRLSPQCNQVLSTAAVIGREFRMDELHAVVDGLSEDQLLEMLEEAIAVRVIEELPPSVGRYQFTHALIRETLYDELTTVRRARLHRHIGESLERLYGTHSGAHLAQLAHHFGEAAPTGQVEKAIEYTVRAAERAIALLAYEEAARHYVVGLHMLDLKEPADDATRCQLLLALGEAQCRAGQFSQARDTFFRAADLARVLGSPEDLARAALGFGEPGWRLNAPGEPAVYLLQEALNAVNEADSPLRASVLGALSTAYHIVGTHDVAETLSRQAVAMARRVGDPLALIDALRVSLFAHQKPQAIEARLASATEMLHLAEAAGAKNQVMEAHSWCLFELLVLGDIPALDDALEALARLAAQRRQPFHIHLSWVYRAMRALLAGRFGEAERLAQQALVSGQRIQADNADGVFGMQMFTLRREQGRLAELEPAVKGFVQCHSAVSTWRPGLALIYRELGREQEARAVFEPLAQHDFADIPHDALWSTCMVYLAEACAFLGDVSRAAILYELLRPYAGRNAAVGGAVVCHGPASRYLGLLAATMSDWERAEKHFEEALAMNASMSARPWSAHTQYDYATMLLARRQPGDGRQAAQLLREALATAQELGMRALERRITAQLNQMTVQPQANPPYPDGLSPREVEVLRLLAAGKSNRDIADTLCVSLNTVATHVRHILSKTGSANRTEAAAYAMRRGLLRG